MFTNCSDFKLYYTSSNKITFKTHAILVISFEKILGVNHVNNIVSKYNV